MTRSPRALAPFVAATEAVRAASWRTRLQGLAGLLVVLLVLATYVDGAGRHPDPDGNGGGLSGDLQASRGPGAANRGADGGKVVRPDDATTPTAAPAAGGAGDPPAGDAPKGDGAGAPPPTTTTGPTTPTPPPAEEPPPAAGAGLPLVVGVAVPQAGPLQELLSGLGLGRRAAPDLRPTARAVVAALNREGGIAGRVVQLREATYDPTVASATEALRASCTQLAQASIKPVAVLGPAALLDLREPCLREAGIPIIGDGLVGADTELLKRNPTLFLPGTLALDRFAAAYGRALVDEGVVRRGDAVGVLRVADPVAARAVQQGLLPVLREAGARVVAQVPLPVTAGGLDGVTLPLAVLGAVGTFRAAGVTRVVGLEQGVLTPLFAQTAESLGYRPRYGLNSTMAPAVLARSAARAQLRDAAGLGFSPVLDVDAAGEPPAPESRTRCAALLRDAKVAVDRANAEATFAQLSLCDSFLLLKAALDGRPTSTPAEVRAGIEAQGERRASAVAYATRLDAERHDGGNGVRRLRYVADCRCIRLDAAR